jgi:hypothetical protein
MNHPATYEYRTLVEPHDDDLNAFGRLGWRVVSVTHRGVDSLLHVLLERVTQ